MAYEDTDDLVLDIFNTALFGVVSYVDYLAKPEEVVAPRGESIIKYMNVELGIAKRTLRILATYEESVESRNQFLAHAAMLGIISHGLQ